MCWPWCLRKARLPLPCYGTACNARSVILPRIPCRPLQLCRKSHVRRYPPQHKIMLGATGGRSPCSKRQRRTRACLSSSNRVTPISPCNLMQIPLRRPHLLWRPRRCRPFRSRTHLSRRRRSHIPRRWHLPPTSRRRFRPQWHLHLALQCPRLQHPRHMFLFRRPRPRRLLCQCRTHLPLSRPFLPCHRPHRSCHRQCQLVACHPQGSGKYARCPRTPTPLVMGAPLWRRAAFSRLETFA